MPSLFPKSKKQVYALTELTLDPELQVRSAGTEKWHAQDIADAVKKGLPVPRPKVVWVKEGERTGRFVVDGFHTVTGYDLAGRKQVQCDVIEGTWEDAVRHAAQANRGHNALPMRPEDKRRALAMMVNTFPKMSAKALAAHVGCSDVLAGEVKNTILGQRPADEPTEVVGQDGKVHKVAPKAKTAPRPKAGPAPKAGEEVWEWYEMENPLGLVIRAGDKLTRAVPGEKDSKEHQRFTRLVGELAVLVKDWHAKLDKAGGK